MSRAKAPVKRRPNAKKHVKGRAKTRRSAPPAARSRHAAPAFPADIILAAPATNRSRPATAPFLPVPAVRDIGSERLLIRKAGRSATIATPPHREGDAPEAPPQALPDNGTEGEYLIVSDAAAAATSANPHPSEGRFAATGGQHSASAVQAPIHPPPQAIPPDVPRPETPVAAPFAGGGGAAAPADEGRTPLPRKAAVTAYKKNGPIEILAYWLRTSGKSLVGMFKRRRQPSLSKQAILEINRLRLENLLLQRQIELLQSQQRLVQ